MKVRIREKNNTRVKARVKVLLTLTQSRRFTYQAAQRNPCFKLLMLVIWIVTTSFSLTTAASAATAAPPTEMPVGKTIIVAGEVNAITEHNLQSRILERRAPVYQVDTVVTGLQSQAQFRMSDGGMLALQENTQVKIDSYEYNAETQRGRAIFELISGGVRSVSGRIKSENGQYKLKTPVGVIGVRGTHYEVRIVDGDLFIAVWDGAIDLSLNGNANDSLNKINAGSGDVVDSESGSRIDNDFDTNANASIVSLGEGENFNFAQVSLSGEVTGFLTPPDIFSQGYARKVQQKKSSNQNDGDTEQSSSDSSAQTSEEGSEESSEKNSEQAGNESKTETSGATEAIAGNNLNVSELAEPSESPQSITAITSIIADISNPISDRVGMALFNDVTLFNTQSRIGQVVDADMSMQINFTDLTVDDGHLQITDNTGGRWDAFFNGTINQEKLDVGVNFASYDNQLAQGVINGQFNNANEILGEIELEVIEPVDTDVINKVSGDFSLLEVQTAN